jgi:hypothetical protein
VTIACSDLIGLPRLPGEIRALTGEHPPSYRDLYEAAVDGIIPARHVRGRWYVDRQDLWAVAMALGLKVPEASGSL